MNLAGLNVEFFLRGPSVETERMANEKLCPMLNGGVSLKTIIITMVSHVQFNISRIKVSLLI